MSEGKLVITEIFRSIQGESTRAGLPCVFVRLTGCDLRCTYCDTEYAFYGGRRMTLEEVLGEVAKFPISMVEITGGEPLLQKAVYPLMTSLIDHGKTVLIETSGAQDISRCDPRVIRIVDVKCPSSGESHRNFWDNLKVLRREDEIKFVIGTREDFDWAVQTAREYHLTERCPVLFSPVWNKLPLLTLGEWVRDLGLPIRLQPQLHKILWGETPTT